MAKADRPVKICTVCKSDPRKPPNGWEPKRKRPKSWPGTKARWVAEKWAARCRVVGGGLCARCYAARGRPPSSRAERIGATERETVWITPEVKAGIERIRIALDVTKSAWLGRVVTAGVVAELKNIDGSPSGAEA